MPILQRDDADDVTPEKKLTLAKKHAQHLSDGGNRRWLEASVDAYGAEGHRATLHVMEGSPPRAYILETRSRGLVLLIDGDGRLIGSVREEYGDGPDFQLEMKWVPA